MINIINKVKFTEETAYEFRDSIEWYESKLKGLGLAFKDEIDKALERIKLNPKLYRKVVRNIRKMQVNRFPYSIFYTIETDILIILRVLHNKRKPIQWEEINEISANDRLAVKRKIGG